MKTGSEDEKACELQGKNPGHRPPRYKLITGIWASHLPTMTLQFIL